MAEFALVSILACSCLLEHEADLLLAVVAFVSFATLATIAFAFPLVSFALAPRAVGGDVSFPMADVALPPSAH